MNPLVIAWQDAIDSFQRTVAQVPDGAFSQPSLLPGWTVADIVAHVAALELELGGEPMPSHEPDWESLPHADDLFSRYTEIGVDYRRGWTPEQLREELHQAAATRSEQLHSGSQDGDRLISGVAGIERTFDHMLRMRTFDIFLHEIDLRDALQMPDPHLAQAARATAGLMVDSLGYVWVKRAGAGTGDVLHFMVPGWSDVWVGVGADGRGQNDEPGEATTTVTVEPMNYLRLASGRRGDLDAVIVNGDQELGRAVAAGLNVAP